MSVVAQHIRSEIAINYKITQNGYEFIGLFKIFEPENQKRIYNS